MAAVDSFALLYKQLARSCSCYVETLALVGALYTGGKAAGLLSDCCRFIRLHFIPRLLSPGDLLHTYGQWAVVSGASEAVAAAYAEELARHGVSVLLVGGDGVSMRLVAASISGTHGVETLCVEADFARGPDACGPLRDAIRGKDIGFVVNCLDRSRLIPLTFHCMSDGELWRDLTDCVAAASLITHLVLPGMSKRRRGAIVNITSGRSCGAAVGGGATRSASMAFLDHFSRSLHCEYRHHGIFVQSLTPLAVGSPECEGGATASWLVPHPGVYARHALSTLGVSHRTTGYWPHTLQLGLTQLVPDWIWMKVIRPSTALIS